jgi:cellulose synthase/poly-beta-1,6-N-acetylglucosamine synthase-like glycosyltransferase
MGTGIVGAPDARSREICDDTRALASQLCKFRIRETDGRIEHAARVSAGRSSPTTAAARRAFALNSHIEELLRAVTERVSDRLKNEHPEFSACTIKAARFIPPLFVLAAMLAMLCAPGTALLCLFVTLPPAFRILVAMNRPAFATRKPSQVFSATPDRELPVYTIIAPLHREARVVDQLLSAIERLDYPAGKLDVIVIVEATDPETHAAITSRRHRLPITVVPAQPVGPCTKPKAINIALELARGEFIAVYDAEDRPEPNQLRRALQAFHASGGDKLACVQARLCVDTKSTWLARYFTAEYAGHFDIFLLKLAELGLPLPLGGSSNHFRSAVLREVGGWDPYNVTEDADLGIRLARFGYRCAVINSTTYEEAPTKVGRWLGQRSRWFKGWMQTFLVHMREPRRLLRELGPRGFVTFVLVVGGNALVALAHPIFLAALLFRVAFADGNLFEIAACAASLLIGYIPSVFLAWRGLCYRGVPNKLRTLAWTPIHWLLLSAAAWCGAFELVSAPFLWNKTEHGLDESDESNVMSELLGLRRHIADIESRGELPQIWIDATCSAADRRRLPPASV